MLTIGFDVLDSLFNCFMIHYPIYNDKIVLLLI